MVRIRASEHDWVGSSCKKRYVVCLRLERSGGNGVRFKFCASSDCVWCK